MKQRKHVTAQQQDEAGIQPHRAAQPQNTYTHSRERDEPSRKQQDGNLDPPVATATPIRHGGREGGKPR